MPQYSSYSNPGNLLDTDKIALSRQPETAGTFYVTTPANILNYLNTKTPFIGSNLPGAYTITTADLGATYNNGTGGVGATLTGTPGVLDINGLLPPINSYVLVNAQTTAAQNGLYQVTNPGSTGVAWVLTRPSFYDGSINGKISYGNVIFVQFTLGLSSNSALYYQSGSVGSTPIIGTTALNYAKVIDFTNIISSNISLNWNDNSAAQFNVTNSDSGSNAFSQMFAVTQGNADAMFGGVFNGGNLWTWGIEAATSDWVLSNSNTLGGGAKLRVSQAGIVTFIDNLDTARGLLGGINTQSGTTYTLAAATAAFKKTLCTNASGCSITFNDSSAANGDEGIIQRDAAAGNITLVAGSGVTINSSPYQSLVIAAPNGRISWWKSATNTYYVAGDLTP